MMTNKPKEGSMDSDDYIDIHYTENFEATLIVNDDNSEEIARVEISTINKGDIEGIAKFLSEKYGKLYSGFGKSKTPKTVSRVKRTG